MENIINYIVESSLCLGILTLFYYGYLRTQNMPRFNRWYLLASLIFTAVLPLLHFTINGQSGNSEQNVSYYGFMLNAVTIYGTMVTQTIVPVVKEHSGISWFYVVGLLLLALRLVYALYRLGLLQRNTQRKKVGDIHVIMTQNVFQPFAFLNTVFVPKSFWETDDSQSIIKHEAVHVKQKHTLDLILLELVLLVQWFNPFVWLLRKAISENHEFLADRAVLDGGVSVSDYQKTLLYQVMGTKFDLGTGFSYSLTKKRFKMMKTQVNNKHVFRAATLSTLLFASVLFVAATEIYNDPNLFLDEPDVKTTPIEQKEEKVIFQVVETMPKYPGGFEALQTFIADNIDYPKVASENGISGKVFVGFVINTKGEVTDAKIIKGVDPNLDAEAMRVINAMPNWSPGQQRGKNVNVAYTIPVNFALTEEKPHVERIEGAFVDASKMKVKDRAIKTIGEKTELKATIIDADNKPVFGATVLAKGTTKGTMTDKKGEFTLLLDNPDQVVVISFVGKKTLSIKLGSPYIDSDEVVFQIVEEMPKFPGGKNAMMKYLAETINYPTIAKEKGIQGRVYCSFVVAKDGSIKNAKVERSVDPSLDQEAIRVINTMPKWIPGMQRGKNVNVSFMLPINFVIQSDKKSKHEKLSVIENTNNISEIAVVTYDNLENKSANEETVFQIVEEMPKFPGGEKAMTEFLFFNFKYPKLAKENGIQGRVYCSFIVAKDGSIKDVKVVRSVEPSLDQEAIRLIKAMPKWIPGKQRGENVNVQFMLPINFAINLTKN